MALRTREERGQARVFESVQREIDKGIAEADPASELLDAFAARLGFGSVRQSSKVLWLPNGQPNTRTKIVTRSRRPEPHEVAMIGIPRGGNMYLDGMTQCYMTDTRPIEELVEVPSEGEVRSLYAAMSTPSSDSIFRRPLLFARLNFEYQLNLSEFEIEKLNDPIVNQMELVTFRAPYRLKIVFHENETNAVADWLVRFAKDGESGAAEIPAPDFDVLAPPSSWRDSDIIMTRMALDAAVAEVDVGRLAAIWHH